MPGFYQEVTGEPPIEPAEIFRRYRQGHERAREFVELWLDAVAAGVATIAAAYDPELLLIGGSVALNNWDIIAGKLPERLKEYLGVREPAIAQASFGDDEVAVGAAALAHHTPETLRRFGYPK
jgi:glucokinase